MWVRLKVPSDPVCLNTWCGIKCEKWQAPDQDGRCIYQADTQWRPTLGLGYFEVPLRPSRGSDVSTVHFHLSKRLVDVIHTAISLSVEGLWQHTGSPTHLWRRGHWVFLRQTGRDGVQISFVLTDYTSRDGWEQILSAPGVYSGSQSPARPNAKFKPTILVGRGHLMFQQKST